MITIIVFQGLIFLVLIFVLRQFMKRHVTGAVGHLQTMNDELMKQQTELRGKISEAEKEYQTKIANVEQEVSNRKAQVRQEANKTLEESRKQALEERERLINEAVETREKMRQEIMAEIDEKAILHSRSVFSEFFSGELRKLVHEHLVKEMIEGIREVQLDQFQIKDDTAALVVAEPLEDESKKKLQKVLKEKIKKEVKFREEIDADLIGGVILRLGSLEIDGSLNNRLKEAAARLKKETARKYQGMA